MSQTRRWVAAGIVSPEQAAQIRQYEQRRAGPRSTLLAEVLAYLGAALVVAAVVAVVASRWEDIAIGGRLAVIGTSTAIGIAGGVLARSRPGAAFDRVTSVLWLASVAGVAGFAALLFGSEGLELSEDAVPPAVAGVSFVLAAALYPLHQRALQLLAAALTSTAFVMSTLVALDGESATTAGLVAIVIGVAWMLQSLRPVLPPYWTGFLFGGLAAWVGTSMLASDHSLLGLGLGALGAGAILGLSIHTRDLLQLGVGAIGMFVTLPRLAVELFGSSVGGPLALLLVGVLLLVFALMAGRMKRREAGRKKSNPSETAPAGP